MVLSSESFEQSFFQEHSEGTNTLGNRNGFNGGVLVFGA